MMAITVVLVVLLRLHSSNGTTSSTAPAKSKLLIIDPFIDFLHNELLRLCLERNVEVIEVVSGYTNAILTSSGYEDYRNVVPGGIDLDVVKRWVQLLDPDSTIGACLSESDVGTTAAERIQVAIGLPGNGISPHLRSKYMVNEACKAAGLHTTAQLLTGEWKAAAEFIDELFLSQFSSPSEKYVVVKPQRGVASDGVYLCATKAEAKTAFEKLIGGNTYGGGTNEELLIQEYASGDEFAVDTVSMGGEVKTLAVWKYSKVHTMSLLKYYVFLLPYTTLDKYI